MVSRTAAAVLVVLCTFVAHARAQKMELADGRQLLRLDVSGLLADSVGEPGTLETPTARTTFSASALIRVAEFLRTFATDGVTDGLRVEPVGERDLIAIGPAVGIAAVERTWATMQRAKGEMFTIEARMCRVPAPFVERELVKICKPAADGDRQAPLVAVVGADAVKALNEAMRADPDAQIVQSPMLTVFHLQQAQVSIGEQVAYIREFELETAKDAQVANPVVSSVFDGQELEVLCASLERGEIGLSMRLSSQTVARPLREMKTTVPGTTFEVTVQIPQVTGCRGSQIARLPDRGTALMAARRNDGTWLLSLVTAIRSAEPANPR